MSEEQELEILQKERTILLNEWEDTIIRVEDEVGKLTEVLGIGVSDSPLIEAMQILTDRYTDMVSDKVGDMDGKLDWYRFDTDFGTRSGMKIGKGEHPDTEVTCVEDLLPFLDQPMKEDCLSIALKRMNERRKKAEVEAYRAHRLIESLKKQIDAASG
jgi:hypothetical protein